jgi:hypothetical protein
MSGANAETPETRLSNSETAELSGPWPYLHLGIRRCESGAHDPTPKPRMYGPCYVAVVHPNVVPVAERSMADCLTRGGRGPDDQNIQSAAINYARILAESTLHWSGNRRRGSPTRWPSPPVPLPGWEARRCPNRSGWPANGTLRSAGGPCPLNHLMRVFRGSVSHPVKARDGDFRLMWIASGLLEIP